MTRKPQPTGLSAAPTDDAELVSLFRQLSAHQKAKFLAWAQWACEDGRPETDPRRLDPFWAEFEKQQAELHARRARDTA